MAERITLIPLKEKVRQLERIYYAAQKEIGVVLLSIDPANYKELEAIKVKERIDVLIRKLNRASIKWVNESVPEAYKKSFIVARTNLEVLGAERDEAFRNKIHRFAVDNYIEDTMKNLVLANQSIKINVNTYLSLARQASSGLAQIQHFDVGDEAVINEIIMDTIEQGKARGAASTRIHEYLRLQLLDGKFISKSGRNYNLRDYSKMVARTRLRQAQTDAVKNTCKQYSNDLVQWSSHASPCPFCAPLEGRIFSISGTHTRYPMLMEEPPLHPNCLLPGQKCITPGGLIAGLRVRYDGPIIKLTLSNGSQLSVTPNHPLLTPCGFAAAQFLCKGDDVFYCSDFERIITSNPYNNGIPSFVEDIIDTLAKSTSMSSRSVPVSSEYLHNDGRFCNGNIDIVRSNSFLGNTGESSFFKKCHAPRFNPSDSKTSFFPGESNLAAMLKSLALTADSIVGGHRSSAPFFLARMRSSEAMTLANGSQGKSSPNESFSNPTPRHTKLFANFMKAGPILISPIKVVSVNIESCHGYVYDLHTYTSLYIVNGVLSSNCEHDLSPTSEVAIEFREARV